MIIPRPASPLVRTTIDLRVNRPDRDSRGSLFTGWGVEVPGNRIF